MKRKSMSLALCAAMAMGTIGVVPAMADESDGTITIEHWVNDRHDSEYMTESGRKVQRGEYEDNIYVEMHLDHR